MSAPYPVGWGSEFDYLHFAACGGWLVSGLLALGFATRRAQAARGKSIDFFWGSLGFVFVLMGLDVFVGSISGWAGWRPDWSWIDLLERIDWIAALLGLAAVFPIPGRWIPSRLARLLIVGVAAAGLLVEAWLGEREVVVSRVAVAALGGLLLAFPGGFESATGSAVRLMWRNRLVGGVAVTAALFDTHFGWGTVLAPRDESPEVLAVGRSVFAGLHAVAAWTFALLLWRAYLREHTLPRIRTRLRLLGLRPVAAFPVVAALSFGVGFGVMEVNRWRDAAEMRARFVEDARSGVHAIAWTGAAGTPGVRPSWQNRLTRLVATRDEFLAAAVLGEGRNPPIVAVASRSHARWPEKGLRLESWFETHLPAAASAPRAFSWQEHSAVDPGLVIAVVDLPARARTDAAQHVAVVFDVQPHQESRAVAALEGFSLVILVCLLCTGAVVYLVRNLNEGEVRSLREQADAENHAKGEFLAMVSHEVRTPLQSVLGYAELASGETLPPDAARHVSAIRSQGAILLRVVQDILDYSANQVGEVRLTREAVSPADLLEDVRRAFADRASVKGLQLTARLAPGVPRAVVLDRSRVAQVLLNLVGNAVKFTAQGRVAIEARVHDASAAGPRGTTIEFTVSDTGPGIPSQQLRRVFEPFRKLRDDDTPGGGGVGLGLAISEQIVRRMDGTISVESTFGRGTTFCVRLPTEVANEAARGGDGKPAVQSRSAAPIDALAGLRVLLIDDNPYVREQLREALRRLGAMVWARPDGKSSISAVRARPFDIVLLDLKLPDMDGCALASALRRVRNPAEKPWVIGMSAGISDEKLERALAGDLDEFLLKPIFMAGLAETIRLSPMGSRIVSGGGAADESSVSEEIRQGFFSEATAVLDRIASIQQEGRTEQVAAEAHYLANGCLMLGLERAFELCREIEELAEVGAMVDVPSKVESLRDSLSFPTFGGHDRG